MRYLITRPNPDATIMANRLRVRGHEVVVSPLVKIRYEEGFLPDPGMLDGIIVTSRNALHGLERRDRYAQQMAGPSSFSGGAKHRLHHFTNLPIYTVGEATAELARKLGFRAVYQGRGRARDLVSLINSRLGNKPNATLYHPCGRHKAYNLAERLADHGIAVIEAVVYETLEAGGFSQAAETGLTNGKLDAVILMSPRTAEIFACLLRQKGLEKNVDHLYCLCLSDKVAEAVKDIAFYDRLIAQDPNLDGMYRLVSQLEI